MTVNTAGTVISGYRFTNGADLTINAQNVTVKDTEFQGGRISTSSPGVLVQDTTFDRAAPLSSTGEGALGYCGYTAVRVKMLNRTEGFRSGCSATTTIRDSFVDLTPPDGCGDWHGDGFQGYTGGPASLTNVVLSLHEHYADGTTCWGNAPFFYPRNQGNTSVNVNHVLVRGGGFSFRDGMPGSVTDLQIGNDPGLDGSWHYGPIDAYCPVVTSWSASIVSVNTTTWTTTKQRDQACNSTGGL
jgi:hypothetical protein